MLRVLVKMCRYRQVYAVQTVTEESAGKFTKPNLQLCKAPLVRLLQPLVCQQLVCQRLPPLLLRQPPCACRLLVRTFWHHAAVGMQKVMPVQAASCLATRL